MNIAECATTVGTNPDRAVGDGGFGASHFQVLTIIVTVLVKRYNFEKVYCNVDVRWRQAWLERVSVRTTENRQLWRDGDSCRNDGWYSPLTIQGFGVDVFTAMNTLQTQTLRQR